MMRTGCRLLFAVTLAGIVAAGSANAQFAYDIDSLLTAPMPLIPEALGDFTHPISTDVPEAQAYFDQGFQLMYAFGKPEAIRSFREAWRRDPNCAMCYWGEAWSWGSYLNLAMSTDDAPHAWAAIQKALELRKHASAKEQAYIDALRYRYVENYDIDRRREQDEAYAIAMRAVYEQYPDDLDAATLYADALFLLEERRGYRDIEYPPIAYIRSLLEEILDRNVRHVGACHLYIHLTESTEQPELAEVCTPYISAALPGASHINHMPSHTWNEIGRWGDSVRANIEAWHSDLRAAEGKGVAIYPSHNLHMMFFAAAYDGQGAIAMRAAKDFTKLTGSSMQESLILLRFGRFEEILELEDHGAGDFADGVREFTRGYARLRIDEPEFAAAHLSRLERVAEATNARVRFDAASDVLGVLAGILRSEIQRTNGDLEAAIETLQAAVEREDSLNYDEPEIVPFAARHWLGAALLEAGEFRAAEGVYRDELDDHPHNGWSLYGLLRALEGRGGTDASVAADFEQSWARSDTWIQASRF